MYERILVALDGSEVADQVLPHVQALAEKFGSSLVLMRVTPPLTSSSVASSPPQDPTFVHRIEQQAPTEHLARIASELAARGHAVELQHPAGDPAHEITEYARRTGVDLIAMTTHGRGGIRRLLMGSVASAVVERAPCPVLLVRRDESFARQAKLESVLF